MSTQETLKQLTVDVCHPEVPDLSDLNKSLLEVGLDSLDFASLVMAVDEKFDIEMEITDDFEQAMSINGIAALVDKLVSQK